MHSKNIAHRDIKPENILIYNYSTTNIDETSIKVSDFGTCNYLKNKKSFSVKVGSPYYIAPEVLENNYDEKCDVWSCGVIMYILLCGYPPFKGKNHKEIFDKI